MLRTILPALLLPLVPIAFADRPKLQVINDSQDAITVFWVNPSGERVPNGTIAAGESTEIGTTIDHQFVIVSSDDKDVGNVICRLPIQAYRYQGPMRRDLADYKPGRWPNAVVLPVDSTMNVPSFYAKIVFADGFPIVASERVEDYALTEAAFLVRQMLALRADVREAMIRSGARLCIMSHDEFTTDLPEFARLANQSPMPGIAGRDFWDARARGLGGSESDPYCSCGEENLLAFPGDPYASENIFIHEFAHNIHLRGVSNVDPGFDARLEKTYRSAMKAGLWSGKYASVNSREYFAEGTQSWFNDNREDDHDHNHVNTRAELIAYDSGLADICREVFGETKLEYTKPTTRLTGHMEGYEPKSAPRFVWPERLEHAKREIRKQAEQRAD